MTLKEIGRTRTKKKKNRTEAERHTDKGLSSRSLSMAFAKTWHSDNSRCCWLVMLFVLIFGRNYGFEKII